MKKDQAHVLRMHMPVLVKAHELNPAPYNPNKLAPAKYEALKDSIRKDGFIDPIVVQKDGFNIIGGHHRLRAIKEICVEEGAAVPEIPCILLDVDDVAAKKLNLKLNHIKGDPDARLLGELLVDLFPRDVRVEQQLEVDVASLGLSLDEATKYMSVIEPDAFTASSEEKVNGFGHSITLSLEFSNVRSRDQIKKLLQHRVEMEKKKSGDIIASLLAPLTKKKNGKTKSATT